MNVFPFAFWKASDGASASFLGQYGYDFDGVDEYINLGSVLNLQPDDTFSMSCWIKQDTVTDNCIIGNRVLGAGYLFRILANKFSFTFITPGGVIIVKGITTVLKGEWTHGVITYNGNGSYTGFNIYHNGINDGNIGSGTVSGTVTPSSNTTIGASGGSINPMDGRLDDIQYYNFELNATQVSNLYNNGFVGAPLDGPTNHWKLGEDDTFSTNWTANDAVGSLTGTSVNMEEGDRKLGVAYSAFFDGVDEYITFGNVLDDDGSSPYTLSVWINMSSTSGTGLICGKVDGSNVGYQLFKNLSTIYFAINGGSFGSDTIYVDTTGTYTANTWYHMLVTYDGSKSASGVTIYRDLIDITDTPTYDNFTGSSLNTGDFNIGARTGVGIPWEGNIMHVSKINKVLSVSERSNLYNSGVPIFPSEAGLTPGFFVPIMGENDTFSTNWTITDESGNGNNGTSVNMEEADKSSNTP